MVLMMSLMGTVVFSSCGDDDDNSGSGSNSKSWFISVSQEELNGAKVELTTYDPLSKRQEIVDEKNVDKYNHIKDPNLFRSDYMNSDGIIYVPVNAGYSLYHYFKILDDINWTRDVYHIVDKSTIECYKVYMMYGDSNNILRRMLHVGSWNYWGEIYYAIKNGNYSDPTIYSYVKSDNKIILSNGDIFHLYDNYVVKDGGSRKMMWFTPVDR